MAKLSFLNVRCNFLCIVNKIGKYEVIVCDIDDNPIITFDSNSISAICAMLDESDLSRCLIKVVRKCDNQLMDIDLMLSIWRNE